MKYVNIFIAIHKINLIYKIDTAGGLVFALSHKGGIYNTVIQVINTDRDCVVDINSEFKPDLNGFKKLFHMNQSCVPSKTFSLMINTSNKLKRILSRCKSLMT